MNNQELELRVKEILNTKNFFDMIVKAKSFEKDYKNSDFYKTTKMPLMEVIKLSKAWYVVQFEDIVSGAQRFLDNIDLSNFMNVIDQLGEVFSNENNEILSLTKELSEIMK